MFSVNKKLFLFINTIRTLYLNLFSYNFIFYFFTYSFKLLVIKSQQLTFIVAFFIKLTYKFLIVCLSWTKTLIGIEYHSGYKVMCTFGELQLSFVMVH